MKKLLTCMALAAFLGAVGCNEGTGTTSKKPGTGGNVPAATSHKTTPTSAKKDEGKKDEGKKDEGKKNDKTPDKPKK